MGERKKILELHGIAARHVKRSGTAAGDIGLHGELLVEKKTQRERTEKSIYPPCDAQSSPSPAVTSSVNASDDINKQYYEKTTNAVSLSTILV
ncbi:MAG: hypothetical protein ABR903_03945 [Thermodesulfovibrionales bacterium]